MTSCVFVLLNAVFVSAEVYGVAVGTPVALRAGYNKSEFTSDLWENGKVYE